MLNHNPNVFKEMGVEKFDREALLQSKLNVDQL